MIKISLPFFIFILITSSYYLAMGWLLLKKNKKYLDVFTLGIVLWLRIIKGEQASSEFKSQYISSRNFKTLGGYYFASGLLFLVFAIYVINW